MPDYLATAAYFEGRAKRAKHVEERDRFRLIAEKYRALAKADSEQSSAAQTTHPTKTAAQLETLIMERLRLAYPQCDTLLSVAVKPINGPGAWIAETVPHQGAMVPAEWQRAKSSITQRLRREFDLAS